ncbi:regulatory protein RecX [Rhodothermus profundi]|uniref:Regulatory protein RecX n=1 Tax=Rhodothermus profundi TaxID=633813 RepID=A0A1M6TEB6_9BACT|nr:RecX family transcriptional regulator [Rhodothermus profundi]SHK55118.1 regulatory protein [Rhodothermus profundi]
MSTHALQPADPPVFREGVVTRLQAQAHNPERISIFLDGMFWMGVHRDVLHHHAVCEGQVLPVTVQRAIYQSELARQARSIALRYLERRQRTVQEVRRRLERAGFSEEIVEQVIAELKAQRYLDDLRYAQAYVEERLAGKGYGPRWLRHELYRRGVPSAVVETALASVLARTSPLEVARPLAQRRWQLLRRQEPDRKKRQQKLVAFLLRRGFSSEIAYMLLRELN